MKRILLAMSYGAYSLCCLAIIYGIGKGAIQLLNYSLGEALFLLAIGSIAVVLLVMLGLMTLALIDSAFGNPKSKVCEIVEELLP
jgi:hypothetical protein